MKLPYTINKPIETIIIMLLLFTVISSFYFYTNFPDKVPTHFNIEGEPDQYSGKIFSAFFFPALIVGIYLLMMFIPLIDPKKEKYQEFSKAYQAIRLILIVYLSALYFLTSLYALGYNINIANASTIGIGILLLIIGNFLPKIKTTWFVGIRTPWTMSDEEVWHKTHRLSGRLFTGGGLLILLSSLIETTYRWWIFLGIIVTIVAFSFIYSYLVWRQKHK